MLLIYFYDESNQTLFYPIKIKNSYAILIIVKII